MIKSFVVFGCFFLALTTVVECIGFQKSVDKESPTIELKDSLILENYGGDAGYGRVDLGELLPGTRYVLDLRLINVSAHDMVFDSAKTTSLSAKVELEKGVLGSAQSTNLKVVFETPLSSASSRFGYTVTVKDEEEKTSARMIFSGTLSGNLYLPHSQGFVLRDEVGEFAIPIEFSAPVKFENLIARKPESLSGLQTEFRKRSDGSAWLVLLAGKEQFDAEYVWGEIVVEDQSVNKKAQSNIVFQKRGRVRVTPSVLRFCENESEKEGFVASALLHCAGKKRVEKPARQKASENQRPKISCRVNGKKIRCEVLALSERLYRVKLYAGSDSARTIADVGSVNITVDFVTENSKKLFTIPVVFLAGIDGGRQGSKAEHVFQEKDKIDRSIFTCVQSNFRAIRQADVLLKYERLFDSTELRLNTDTGLEEPCGAIVETVEYIRIVFDIDAGKFATYQFTTTSTIDLERGSEPVSSVATRGMCLNGSKERSPVIYRNGVASASPIKIGNREFYKTLGTVGFADFRSLVTTGTLRPHKVFFGDETPAPHVAGAKEEMFYRGSEIHHVRETPFKDANNVEKQFCHRNTYDALSLMPLSLHAYHRGEANYHRDMVNRKFDWHERNGLYILKSASMSSLSPVVVNKKRMVDTLKRDYKTHWFSVNAPKKLDVKLFDASYFENAEAFSSQVDPAKLGVKWDGKNLQSKK